MRRPSIDGVTHRAGVMDSWIIGLAAWLVLESVLWWFVARSERRRLARTVATMARLDAEVAEALARGDGAPDQGSSGR